MGWTSYFVPSASREALTKELQRAFIEGYTVIDVAFCKRKYVGDGGYYKCAYAAVKDPNGNVYAEVMCYVAQHQYRGCYKLHTKYIPEDWGPCEQYCPEKILRLLTPTNDEYALAWRDKCWANARRTTNNEEE